MKKRRTNNKTTFPGYKKWKSRHNDKKGKLSLPYQKKKGKKREKKY